MEGLGNEEISNRWMRCWPDCKSVDLLISVVSSAQGSFSVSISLLSAPKDNFLAQLFGQIAQSVSQILILITLTGPLLK